MVAKLAALVVLLQAVAILAQTPTTQSAIIEGTRTETAAGGGTWRSWINASGARLLCANDRVLWFGTGSAVWRYNALTQKVDVWTTPLTSYNLKSVSYTALSDSGRFAVCGGEIQEFDGNSWHRLPQPAGESNPPRLAYDANNDLWAIGYAKAYRWGGQQWDLGIKIPQNTGVWALDDHWVMWNNFGQGKEWKTFSLFDSRFAASTGFPADVEKYPFIMSVYHVGPRLMVAFGGVFRCYWDVCEVLKDNIVSKAHAPYVGLDLVTAEAWSLDANDETHARVVDADGNTIVVLPKPGLDTNNGACLLRDRNGHYWFGNYRSTGQEWQTIMPPGAFDFAGDLREAMATGRLKFDEASQAWVNACPEIPAAASCCDLARKTGWLMKPSPSATLPTYWDLYQFAADHPPKRLQTVEIPPIKFARPQPLHRDTFGDVWFRGFFRWDGNLLCCYTDGRTGGSGAQLGYPQLVPSADGELWMYHTNRLWLQFDRAKNILVESPPYEHFAFTVLQRRMAIVGLPFQDGWDYYSHMGLIYQQDANGWRTLPNPFNGGPPVTGKAFPDAPMRAVPGAGLRGNRMLVSTQSGVFEWDIEKDRWAYLAPQPSVLASYDAAGRRVLVLDNGRGPILRYEGDPFAAGPSGASKLESRVAELLADMDADSYAQRDQATNEAINLIRKHPTEVAEILRRLIDSHHSAEQAVRTEIILKEVAAEPTATGFLAKQAAVARRIGNSLLERMHPPMPPECSYTLAAGMEVEHALAVLAAAGAKRSAVLQNLNSNSRLGFLLPDNTMLYLRMEDTNGTGKILSLGLGQTGRGLNKEWNWDDPTTNSLTSLDLRPSLWRPSD